MQLGMGSNLLSAYWVLADVLQIFIDEVDSLFVSALLQGSSFINENLLTSAAGEVFGRP